MLLLSDLHADRVLPYARIPPNTCARARTLPMHRKRRPSCVLPVCLPERCRSAAVGRTRMVAMGARTREERVLGSGTGAPAKGAPLARGGRAAAKGGRKECRLFLSLFTVAVGRSVSRTCAFMLFI